MTPPDVLLWFSKLLGPGFDVAAAEALLGPALSRPTPNRVALAPLDSDVESVVLELDREERLAGVAVRLKHPVPFRLDLLTAKFGAPTPQRPPQDRAAPKSVAFWRSQSEAYLGSLSLTWAGDDATRVAPVTGVLLRRAPS